MASAWASWTLEPAELLTPVTGWNLIAFSVPVPRMPSVTSAAWCLSSTRREVPGDGCRCSWHLPFLIPLFPLVSVQEEFMAVGMLCAGAGGEGGKEVRCPEHGSPVERSTGQAGSTPSLLTSDLEIDRSGSRILCRH